VVFKPGTMSTNVRLPNDVWDIIDYSNEHPTESRSQILTRIVREWAASKQAAVIPKFVKPAG
jgi:hypothetical protein